MIKEKETTYCIPFSAGLCKQCKKELDLISYLTSQELCGKCIRKNHKKLTR